MGSTVGYQINGSMNSCVSAAFTSWTSTNSGHSNVSFGSGSAITVYKTALASGVVGGINSVTYDGQHISGGVIFVTSDTNLVNDCAAWTKAVMHELGHLQNLGDLYEGGGSSIMNQMCGFPNDSSNCVPSAPTTCDRTQAKSESKLDDDLDGFDLGPEAGEDCDDTRPDIYPLADTDCAPGYNRDEDRDCTGYIDSEEYGSCPASPIVIDVIGNGFSLTDREHGVAFDLDGDGQPEQIPWIAVNSDDGWLVLDRNANGTIDNGAELFGNFTPQPVSTTLNGFEALAVFDKPEDGGNADGWVDANDEIFARLRIWLDINHDGVSQGTELRTMPSLQIRRLSLEYHATSRSDAFGNWFRFFARVDGGHGRDIGPKAYDVFLGGRDGRGRALPPTTR
jgi:hypothetical protein